jgi:hypothetical protein
MLENDQNDNQDWTDGTSTEGPVLGSMDSFVDPDDEKAVGIRRKEKDMDQLSIEHASDFMTQTNRPSLQELEDLVIAGTPEAWERLRELSDQYNILVDDGSDAKQIAEQIRQAMDNADDMIY